jgi:hypothetical protein
MRPKSVNTPLEKHKSIMALLKANILPTPLIYTNQPTLQLRSRHNTSI